MNQKTIWGFVSAAMFVVITSPALAGFPKSPLKKCAADAVVSGTLCMDKYEASVWRVPNATTTNAGLVKKIQQGKATAADLAAGGATQLGTAGDDFAPCADNGQDCANDIYALSLPAQSPAKDITWFQAQAACENSLKRLPSNAEWQAAVVGTPDPGPDNGSSDCNTQSAFAPTATGSRSACVSADGAFDMVGNLAEMVADWLPRSTACGTWSAAVSPTGDLQCLGGADTAGQPGALLRGGYFGSGPQGGPFELHAEFGPYPADSGVGFRCAR